MMVAIFRSFKYRMGILLLLVCLCAGGVMYPVSGAGSSDLYEGMLGDTINLHGVSYAGNQVYLFFTGPNLPENGVTLTDPTQRADQGHFTIVDLDRDQQWSMKWNTARIDNEIVAGTYTVYVANEPVDRSGLSGNNYNTITVYLKDYESSDFPASSQTSYTLNPKEHTSNPVAAPIPVITTIPTPEPTVTTIPTPEPTVTTMPSQTSMAAQTPAEKITIPVMLGVIAIFGTGVIFLCHRQTRKKR